MPTQPKDLFLLEEYKALREEIIVKLKQQFIIQKWICVAIAIIYAAAFTAEQTAKAEWARWVLAAWFVPPIITAAAFAYYCGNDRVLWQLSQYIQQIEARFCKAFEPKGWETFLGHKDKRFPWGIRNPFWWITLSLTIVVTGIRVIHKIVTA